MSALKNNEVVAQLHSANLSLSAENSALKEQLNKANAQIIWFKEQVKLIRHKQFGKQSEQMKSLQIVLPLFDDNESDEVTETETPISPEKIRVTYEREKKKKTTGRNIDTSNLPREQIIHDLSDAEKICACGNPLCKIGEDKSEQLELVPAQLKVIEHITPKYTCRHCETIKAAKKPESPFKSCRIRRSSKSDYAETSSHLLERLIRQDLNGD